MIGQFFALYRARKDLDLAKRLAGEMIVNGVIGRVGWPLTVAKFWMSVGIVLLSALILLLVIIGSVTHWTLAIPALPLAGGVYGIVRLWRGINAGVDHVTRLAKIEISNRAAALTRPSPRSTNTRNIPQ